MILTVTVLVVASIFFAIGKVRADVVALCALLVLVWAGILTVPEALAGFSNNVVLLMAGLFVVSGAIFRTGVARYVSAKILRLGGQSETRLFLLVMLVTCAVGSFVSNSGTVALMMPIVAGIASATGLSASRFLMPLAYASSMGGMMTLIGTAPNLVINQTLRENNFPPLEFFSFTPVGLVCITTGIIVLLPLSKWLLSRKGPVAAKRGKSLQDLAREYQLSDQLFRARLPANSPLCGRTAATLSFSQTYGLHILEVRRESASPSGLFRSVSQHVARADTELSAGDILYLRGDFEQVRGFAKDENLELLDTHTPEDDKGPNLNFYDIGIAEIILPNASALVGRTVAQTQLRANYGLNVLGVRRKAQYILRDIKDCKLHEGDMLLVQGSWENIGRLDDETEQWVVLGRPLEQAAAVTLDYRAPVAALIMIGMIAAMVFGAPTVTPVTAVLTAAVLMVLSGCFRNVQAAYKTINWGSVVLIACMLPMATAMQKTGASMKVSEAMISTFGGQHPLLLLAGVYLCASVLTLFISNTAVAVLLAPIAMTAAVDLGLSPLPFLFAVSVGASMSFTSPYSTPSTALVMGAGQYRFMDFIKVGFPLQLIMGVVMMVALPLIFPFNA